MPRRHGFTRCSLALGTLGTLTLGALGCGPRAEPAAPVASARPQPVAPTAGAAPATPSAGPIPWQHDWARGAVFYEVFVRSFHDADGDGIGDLRGLIDRLDHLNDGDPATHHDLGVDGIWLMPVFVSPSYHGYDVVDYEHIDPEYGTDEDFVQLCREAHRRGMRVIVDLVVNHTSAEHPWFRSAARALDAPYRDWYEWRDHDPGWQRPWGGGGATWHPNPHGPGYYYGIFWGGMPDLNFRNPAVGAEMKRVAALWLGRGADGFRLDATRYLVASGDGALQSEQPETHAYLRDFSAHVRAIAPAALLVGENWTFTAAIASYYGDTSVIPGGDELPANFDFPLADAIVSGIRGGTSARIYAVLAEKARTYPAGVLDAPFLRNHDQIRLASELDAHPARLRLAAAILLTLPGIPFLYYGEEVGLENGPGLEDEQKRTPMPWQHVAHEPDARVAPGGGFTRGTPWHAFAPGRDRANVADQAQDPLSLLAHYRRWIRLRKRTPALRHGTLEAVAVESPHGLVYLRRSAEQTALVAHNLDDAPVRLGPLPAVLRLDQAEQRTAAAVSIEVQDHAAWLSLPAHASAVLILAP